MAVVTNGREGAARLAVDVDVLRPEREPGLIQRGCVSLSSSLDLVWARVTYTLGDSEFFGHDVLLQSDDLRDFADGVLQLLDGQVGEVRLDIGSPELGLQLRRLDWPSTHAPRPPDEPDVTPWLTLLVFVDVGIAAGADSVSRTGPALLLEPSAEEIQQFGRDLRSETELVLCL